MSLKGYISAYFVLATSMLIGDCFFPFKHNSGHFSKPVEKQVRYDDKLRAAIIFIMLWIILGQLIKFVSREYHSFV